LVSTAFTSVSSVTGVTFNFSAESRLSAADPHGTVLSQSATFTPGLARSATAVMLAGFDGGTTRVRMLVAYTIGVPSARPASVTVFIVASLAVARMSAGAPCTIWAASAELPPKLSVMVTPGCSFSKRAASSP